ncbi:MFS transporter [Bacillus tuaregi]|uniref:MFS transporter n=1 Tax=Bacillus tuaregi TaxID=1816695 RepID=UPI0008F7E737|nr:MFS transporter [Bacillus tuaregi]
MEKQNNSYRWIVFSSVLLAYFLIVSQRTAPGLITDQVMKDFQISAAVVGLITSIQFVAYSGLQIPVGLLSDRFGPNRFLIIGTLLNGIGTILYSLATHESILLFSRLLVGVGDATIWVNVVLILNQWFKGGEFTRLLGLAGVAGSLGSLLATVPFSSLITLAGWRPVFLSTGIVLCFISGLLYFVLEKKAKQNGKKDLTALVRQPQKHEKTSTILKRVLSSRQAWATFFCHFGVVGTYVGFIGSWGVPYGMNVLEVSRSAASQLMMYGLIGAIAGSLLISQFTSRLGSVKRSYLAIQIMIFLSWVTLFVIEKPPFMLAIFLLFLIGFGHGGGPLTFAIVRSTFPQKEVGVVTGFANTGGFISAVLLPFFFGQVLDMFQLAPVEVGYHYGLLIPVIFTLIGLIGGMLIKEQQKSTKPLAKSSEII